MAVNDPIADMLTRIRNGLMARHENISIPASRTKVAISELLKKEGFIKDFQLIGEDTLEKKIRLKMAYLESNEPAIIGLRRVSRPGLRVYVQKGEIPRVFGGLGIAIVSTSQGLMTGREARKQGIGGELLCHVW
ncbi:MAG: 30S ribosomal protein S8 [Dehalococcoidia bacterium]|tara:strand:- start:323 stop:724 length:402 start_codon:yes stop_codon:yes gene_type:complete